MFYGSFKKQYLQTGSTNKGIQPTRVPLRFKQAADACRNTELHMNPFPKLRYGMLRDRRGYACASFIHSEAELAASADSESFRQAELAGVVALNLPFLADPLGNSPQK